MTEEKLLEANEISKQIHSLKSDIFNLKESYNSANHAELKFGRYVIGLKKNETLKSIVEKHGFELERELKELQAKFKAL